MMLSDCLPGTTQSMPVLQKWVMCLLIALFLSSVGCRCIAQGSSRMGAFTSQFLVYFFVSVTGEVGEVLDIAGSLGPCFLGVSAILYSLCARNSSVKLVLLVVSRTLGSSG